VVVGVNEDAAEWRNDVRPSLVKMVTVRACVERERGRGEGVRVERAGSTLRHYGFI
jgi:hypothetical protein